MPMPPEPWNMIASGLSIEPSPEADTWRIDPPPPLATPPEASSVQPVPPAAAEAPSTANRSPVPVTSRTSPSVPDGNAPCVATGRFQCQSSSSVSGSIWVAPGIDSDRAGGLP